MAAENRSSSRAALPLLRFNEAAAHGRGKPEGAPHGARVDAPRFNEAAAHGRGKRRPRSGATAAIGWLQ